MIIIINFKIEKQTANGWEEQSLWNSPGLARGAALRAWARNPEERPDLRVIRVGSSYPAYVFRAGKFRKNAGKWQRVPVRRFSKI
jgi:hypothetical protein